MKAQVSILVKKESVISKFFSFISILDLFKKTAVYIYIDNPESDPIYLEAREEPYFLELEPGQHQMLFQDSKKLKKKAAGGLMKVASGVALGAFNMGLGGSFTSGFSTVMDMKSPNGVQDGMASFILEEGEVIQLLCRPSRKGSVNVKRLK